MPIPTGFPASDAQDDFSRVRRRQVLSRLGAILRGRPGALDVILPFDEVVGALGYLGEHRLGVQSIPLDTIVGTVDRGREFDRRFRPRSGRTRQRFERLATASRRGEAFPPIDVYRVGQAHFVRDGHHRVAVARALGHRTIDAHVTEVRTRIRAGADLRLTDLPLKDHERVFRERVPLPREHAARVRLRNPWDYGALGEGVEAWGYRHCLEQGRLLGRTEVARAWFEQEFAPVTELLVQAGLVEPGEEADGYLRLGSKRYRLLRTFSWDESVIEALRDRRRSPSA